MSGAGNNDSNEKANLKLDTPRALADINYNSLIAAEKGTSSEDEASETQEIPADDARIAISVSISPEQTRLTSPKTPAVDKAAAIERAGGFFGLDGAGADATLVEEPEEETLEEDDREREESVTAGEEQGYHGLFQVPKPQDSESSLRKTSGRLPSPWRAEPSTEWQQGGKAKSGLLDGLLFNRHRANTESTLEGWQRSLLSSLPSMPSMPSMPRHFSLSSPFSGSNDAKNETSAETANRSKISSSAFKYLGTDSGSSTPTISGRQRAESDGRVPPPKLEDSSGANEEQQPTRESGGHIPPPTAQSRANVLRRSTSDQSFVTQRTLSTVESLGDDSRFEHVHDQVNSRFKAIKDSWQDSNIKLPSLSNISVSNFTPDFLRERAGSLNKRQGLKQAAGNGNTATPRSLDDSVNYQTPVGPMTRQPFISPKAAVSDATSGKPATHPNFNRALEQLEGDLVILGGYRGSILRSAEPPHRQFWVPVKVGLNLRKVNLEVGLEAGDDERATEKVIPDGMLTHIGPVDIARRLLKRLRSCRNARSGKLRVHDYGYDWRLDPAYLSKQLVSFLETLACNKPNVPKEKRGAIVLAHSLGGLITRHAINQRPELFRGIVYAGVPSTCVNILGPMRNGDEVLLSNRVLTAQVNFTIRTSFALLPLDGRCFFDKRTREDYPVDFFDPQTWIDFKLSPCVGRPLPPLVTPAKPTGITGYVSSMTSALPSLPLPGRKASLRSKNPPDTSRTTATGGALEPDMSTSTTGDGNVDQDDDDTASSVGTTVTIPREKAVEYLTRTLASVKKFKQDLAFNPAHGTSNKYPPVSVIYGKSTPTVFGAKVDGREGIKHADAYDELAFASGDGVVLARAAMVPQGYTTARGGVVSSERGHVTLLSDLEAVGKCVNAVIGARKKGVGLGD